VGFNNYALFYAIGQLNAFQNAAGEADYLHSNIAHFLSPFYIHCRYFGGGVVEQHGFKTFLNLQGFHGGAGQLAATGTMVKAKGKGTLLVRTTCIVNIYIVRVANKQGVGKQLQGSRANVGEAGIA